MEKTGDFAVPILRVNSHTSDTRSLTKMVSERGGLVLRAVADEPSRDRIMELGRALGQPRKSVVGIAQDRNNLVHEVRPNEPGIKDNLGRLIRSTSFDPLSLHTDGYNAETPPRIVLLQVVNPGLGGLTTAAKVEDVANSLRQSSVDRLMLQHYPYLGGVTPILWQEDDFWCMRYNFYEMQPLISKGINTHLMEPEDGTALSELFEVLDYLEGVTQNRTLLHRGDVLILDNRRVLHGRLNLRPGDSERLLYRVWCN